MIDQTNNLELIATNFDEIGEHEIYMKQQITDLNKLKRIKLNFNYCHIAISKNGGLIAICKKKTFLDISRKSKINDYIIVLFQNAETLYEIPIDWKYNERWIVCLDFTEKQDLYGILNDGGIFKFKYIEKERKEKVTSQELKSQGIVNAKFFKKGFIAYTKFENFYYIKDIKDPKPILLFNMSGLVKLPSNFDFIPISPDNSESKKIEILLIYQEGNGVVHIEQKLNGENFQVKIIDENNSEVVGMNLILNGKPQPLKLNNKKKLEGEYPEGFGKIDAIAISPSGQKIAFYNGKNKVGFIMNSNFRGNYSKVLFEYNEEEYSKNEIGEINTILSYKEGYQFLFCGEDAIALSGQRFVIISNPNGGLAKPYLIKEGEEILAIQGILFSKCISEKDGLRCLTNDGVFFIGKVDKELVDICAPFSKSNSKKFIQLYKNILTKKFNCHKDIKSFGGDLPDIIHSLQVASANIFWTEDENEDQKKEVQLFVLKAAQYGKNFVNKEEFNYTKFNGICKNIRIINQLRNDEKYPIFITYNEYIEMDPLDMIEILIKYKNFKVAAEMCKFLEYNQKKVKYKFMLEKMKYKIKQVDRLIFSQDKSKEYEKKEEEIYQNLLNEIDKMEDISYVNLAKKAIKFGSEKLGMKLLEQEKSALTKIPQLIELNKTINSLNICFETYDYNILSIVLGQLTKKTDILEILCNPELKDHYKKILLFFKKYKPYMLEEFLNKTNDNKELFFMKLDEYYNSQSFDNRKQLLEKSKNFNKNSNTFNKYKKYLESLEQNLKFKKACIDENIIHYSEIEPYNQTVYDCFLNGFKKGKSNLIESKNKNLDYSNKKLNIIRFRAYLEMNTPEQIDNILEKTPLKKLGLTPMHMGEMYYDYKFYSKATDYLLQVKEKEYNSYIIDLLISMGKNKEALEIIISDKDNENMVDLVNDILKKNPKLKEYVDQLCVKYKVNLQ